MLTHLLCLLLLMAGLNLAEYDVGVTLQRLHEFVTHINMRAFQNYHGTHL